MELSQGRARNLSDLTKSDFMHWWYSVPVYTRLVIAISAALILFSLYGSLLAPYIGWEVPLCLGAFHLGKKRTDKGLVNG